MDEAVGHPGERQDLRTEYVRDGSGESDDPEHTLHPARSGQHREDETCADKHEQSPPGRAVRQPQAGQEYFSHEEPSKKLGHRRRRSAVRRLRKIQRAEAGPWEGVAYGQKFRAYQNSPANTMMISQTLPRRKRSPRGTMAITPTLTAAAGTMNVNFAPKASEGGHAGLRPSPVDCAPGQHHQRSHRREEQRQADNVRVAAGGLGRNEPWRPEQGSGVQEAAGQGEGLHPRQRLAASHWRSSPVVGRGGAAALTDDDGIARSTKTGSALARQSPLQVGASGAGGAAAPRR